MKRVFVIFVLSLSLLSTNLVTEASTTNEQLIIINKSINQLAFYDNGKLVKTFKVATGRKPSYTPEGKMKIVNKIKNRPYYKAKIKGGDPRNPLGDRWLGLNARGTYGTTYAIHGNNNSKSIGTYASAGCIRMYNEDVRWLFNRIKLNASVVIISSKQTFDQIAVANNYPISSKLNHVALDKQGPQPVNTPVKATATVKGGSNPMYQFSVLSGSKWTTIQPYSSKNSVTYLPTKPGTYKFKVHVRNQKSNKAYEDERVIDYIVYEPGRVTSFTTNKTTDQPVGTAVTLFTETNNSNNLVKFSLYDGKGWQTISDYSFNKTFDWKPINSGSYKLKVSVKNKLSKAVFDQEKEINFNVYQPGSVTSVSTNVSSLALVGTKINIAAASNHATNNLYKISVHDGGTWTVLKDFSSTPTADWIPSKSGSYKIEVQVKHILSKTSFDHKQELPFSVYEPVSLIDLTPSNHLLSIDSIYTLAARATGGSELQYRFDLWQENKWMILQDYSLENKYEWKTPTVPGDFKIRVLVKSKASKNEYDVIGEQIYSVQ